MLNRRTKIRFDDEMYALLTREAAERKTSIGALVRQAVTRTFTASGRSEERHRAITEVLKIRPQPAKTDYKELINYGRKDL
jgi:hypothetical protein